MLHSPPHFHYVNNNHGWEIRIKQCPAPQRPRKNRRPVLIVPGYGMNSTIFGFHPSGLSMEDYFVRRGFETWSVDFRNQGGSIRRGGHSKYSLFDIGAVDLKVACDFVVHHSISKTRKVDLVGCSLGGTYGFIYATTVPDNHLGSLVAIGSPLRWESAHPLLKIISFFPQIIGLIPFYGTREIFRILFPIISKSPLLHIYLHPNLVDLDDAHRLLETIENPNRHLNREIARWVFKKDLILHDINITREVHRLKNPQLCVVANADGIVPPMTALSAHECSGSKIKETLVVGTEDLRFAHADLFLSRFSQEKVFKPIADWLAWQS